MPRFEPWLGSHSSVTNPVYCDALASIKSFLHRRIFNQVFRLRRNFLSVQPGRPPAPASREGGKRRHQQRPDEKGVNQHADAYRCPDLKDNLKRRSHQGGEGAGENNAAGRNDAACVSNRPADGLPCRKMTGLLRGFAIPERCCSLPPAPPVRRISAVE